MSTAGKRSNRVRTERSEVTLDDFAAEIIHLGEGQGEHSNILVYGDSNVGKTRLQGTCPERTFWLVCEPGYKTAERWREEQKLPPHKGARRITDSATALAAVDWLNDRQRYRKLDWLVVDGISTMQDRIRLAYAQEAFDIDPKTRQHRNIPDRPDYFSTQNFLKTWLGQLVDLPVNLLVTAHPYRTDKTENGELLVFPGFQGKVSEVSNAISGLMDVTAYYAARRVRVRDSDETRVLRRLWFTQPTGKWGGDDVRYVVGDKFDCLGPYMDNPTVPDIMARINGEETDG